PEYYIPIFPDTDIYMLLSMMNIIFKENLEDREFLEKNTTQYLKLKKKMNFFTPELAEQVCKIPSEVIHKLTGKFIKTKKAVIYGRLGTCLSTYSTLNAWAIDVLNIIAGKFDRPGGAIFGKNIINISKLSKIIGLGKFNTFQSRIGKYPDVMGALPLGILAREILIKKNPVRALLISGGNPALSAPNSNEFKKALEKLELCVILDFYVNETAQIAADYILPTRTPLENSNIPIYLLNYQIFPHIDYTHPIITPDIYGPKPEWEILQSLAKIMGVPIFGSKILNFIPKIYSLFRKQYNPEFFIKLFLFLGQILEKKIPKLSNMTFTLKKIKKSGTIVLGNNDYGVLKNYIQTKDKKITLFNFELEKQLEQCKNSVKKKIKFIKSIESNPNAFTVIGRRNLKTMNSWMHNIESLWRKKQEPKLLINTQDANQLNLKNDDIVIVENNLGSINIPIQLTDDIIRNVICYPHGWGHRNPKLSFANQYPGENINILTDSRKLDRYSGQPLMNGYRVILKKK
ncbi:MAG: molybdopterin-containing oxidoreductase family protein, partial [Promethearchaeota archaeon]